jgi:hypothetical protein
MEQSRFRISLLKWPDQGRILIFHAIDMVTSLEGCNLDWLSLQASQTHDRDLPERAHRLTALMTVVDGRQYDALAYPFSAERNGAGEYVPLAQPSVRAEQPMPHRGR